MEASGATANRSAGQSPINSKFGEGGDWGVVNPDWGTAFLSPEWMLTHLCPRWRVLELAPATNGTTDLTRRNSGPVRRGSGAQAKHHDSR